MIDLPSFLADVLIEILLRVPVKQLCQLKIISKQWLLIISSPHFKILYNQHSVRRPQLLLVDKSHEGNLSDSHGPLSRTVNMSVMDISTGIIRRELSKYVLGRHYLFLFACNLICYTNYASYSICNPTTNEHVHLPSASFDRSRLYCGYLQETNEYKIVHVCGLEKNHEDRKVRFKILALKDGEPMPSSWRIIENYTPNWSYNAPSSVSIKCFIYWLIYSRDRTKKSIISIDLTTETFTTISCPEVSPPHVYENGDREQLTEIKGKLCLTNFSQEYSTLWMYVLNENNIWVKEYRIHLSNMDQWFRIVGYLPCEDDNGDLIFHCNKGILLSYNIDDRSFRRLGHSELPSGCHVNFYYDRLFSFGAT